MTSHKQTVRTLTLVFGLFGLSAPATAGRIVSAPADMPHAPEGFGGWNLDNVSIEVPDGSFDPATGAYAVGKAGLYYGDVSNEDGVVTGTVVGKSWPVGEPPGIKVVNDDLDVNNDKPTNCLMTTSYLAGSYLDAKAPVQTICSSGFQTHKRFKVNMSPDSIGSAIDLVFNVVPDKDSRDYQVFQKINNYTDVRLEGFTIQIGVGTGDSFQAAGDAFVTAKGDPPLGLSTPDAIFDADQRATFSHGLFGPADNHFPEDGFFDDTPAGFMTEIVEYTKGGGVGDTFRSTGTLGSNYNQVPPETGPAAQFGPWLPSTWTPRGVFFDDDGDPETDPSLLAFWAETAEGSGEYAWLKGNNDGFAAASDEELAAWGADEAYDVDVIEDLLNLGLNYVVTVGTVDESWPTWDAKSAQATFTVRIVPTEDTSGIGEPGYVTNLPDDLGGGDDTGSPDTGTPDTDAPTDTDDVADTGEQDDKECGCAASGGAAGAGLPVLFLLAMAARRRRE